jgi:hypothetical protein
MGVFSRVQRLYSIIKQTVDKPEQADNWGDVELDILILVACCDGAPPTREEEVALDFQASLVWSENTVGDQKQKLVAARKDRIRKQIKRIEEFGSEKITQKILSDAQAMLGEFPEDVRHQVLLNCLRNIQTMVRADMNISSQERVFVTDFIGPAFGLPEEAIQNALKESEERIFREQALIDDAFEIYVMIENIGRTVPRRQSFVSFQSNNMTVMVEAFCSRHGLCLGVVGSLLGQRGAFSSKAVFENHLLRFDQIAHQTMLAIIDGREQEILSAVVARHQSPPDQEAIESKREPLRILEEYLKMAMGFMEESLEADQRAFLVQTVLPALGSKRSSWLSYAKSIEDMFPALYQILIEE